MIKYLAVWHNLNNDTYYYRFIWNNEEYHVGYINQYNHVLVIYEQVSLYVEKVSLSYYTRKEIRRIVSLLEKI